jgi:transcriptional regulator with XRE-family HTH domain
MTEKEFFQSIGQSIKQLRKEKKMTQKDVAEIAGVNRSVLANFEASGEGVKSADIIRRMVEATGHTMSDLFDDGKKKLNLRLTSRASQNRPCPV